MCTPIRTKYLELVSIRTTFSSTKVVLIKTGDCIYKVEARQIILWPVSTNWEFCQIPYNWMLPPMYWYYSSLFINICANIIFSERMSVIFRYIRCILCYYLYSNEMKLCLIFVSILSVFGDKCAVKAPSYQVCQKICDLSSSCDVWMYRVRNKDCFMKRMSGSTTRTLEGHYSGFRNMGPFVRVNVDTMGGDYACAEQTVLEWKLTLELLGVPVCTFTFLLSIRMRYKKHDYWIVVYFNIYKKGYLCVQ